MNTVEVQAPGRNAAYPILIEDGLLSHSAGRLASLAGRRAVIVTDEHVAPLYAPTLEGQLFKAGVTACRLTLPPGETTKSPEYLMRIYDVLLEKGITRQDALIALGGGVIGDLTGFAAATWMRGIRFIQIPTTLLAQVDSSVGGKVAVNHPGGKNLLGAFYQPELVLIDTATLRTLDERQVAAGMAEVIKYGCLADASLFEQIETLGGLAQVFPLLPQIVARCCAIKARYVHEDPFDQGLRMQLNFGHTLAHAVENLCGYGRYLHGEAVAIGMTAASRWGEALGLTPTGTHKRISNVLSRCALPCALPQGLSTDALMHAMSMDKKSEGDQVRVVLLDRIGACHTERVSARWLAEHC